MSKERERLEVLLTAPEVSAHSQSDGGRALQPALSTEGARPGDPQAAAVLPEGRPPLAQTDVVRFSRNALPVSVKCRVEAGATPRGMMKKRANMEALLTVHEVAGLLRVAPGTLYNWAYRRKIPAQKVGGRLLFSPSALRRWLRDRERQAAGEERE